MILSCNYCMAIVRCGWSYNCYLIILNEIIKEIVLQRQTMSSLRTPVERPTWKNCFLVKAVSCVVYPSSAV